MAALLTGGLMLVLAMIGFLLINQRLQMERIEHWKEVSALQGDIDRLVREHDGERAEDWNGEMLKRLLDAALPVHDLEADAGKPGTDAEYEPPADVVGDWTDPFFGLERPLVAGLAPGQAIPGIGESAAEYDYQPEPVPTEAYDDGGWQARGEELFEDWDSNRG